MPEKNNLDWKTYESITKYVYEALGQKNGVKVLGYGSNYKVQGKSGVNHQIDILTSVSDGIHIYKTAIECKYWKEKISKETVMKVSEIIEDAGIHKGVIVTKNGFTKDAVEFAKYKNISLSELKEHDETAQDAKPKEFEIGEIDISAFVTIIRPEILSTKIEYSDKDHVEKETINIYAASIRLSNGDQKPFKDYTLAFQSELRILNRLDKQITKQYEISEAYLVSRKGYTPIKIEGVTFTGVLKKIDSNSKRTFSLVDKVWLIMNSIFEERTFSISENGIIIENKK